MHNVAVSLIAFNLLPHPLRAIGIQQRRVRVARAEDLFNNIFARLKAGDLRGGAKLQR